MFSWRINLVFTSIVKIPLFFISYSTQGLYGTIELLTNIVTMYALKECLKCQYFTLRNNKQFLKEFYKNGKYEKNTKAKNNRFLLTMK